MKVNKIVQNKKRVGFEIEVGYSHVSVSGNNHINDNDDYDVSDDDNDSQPSSAVTSKILSPTSSHRLKKRYSVCRLQGTFKVLCGYLSLYFCYIKCIMLYTSNVHSVHVHNKLHHTTDPTTLEDPPHWRTHHTIGPTTLEEPPHWRTHHTEGPITLEDPPHWRTHYTGGPTTL